MSLVDPARTAVAAALSEREDGIDAAIEAFERMLNERERVDQDVARLRGLAREAQLAGRGSLAEARYRREVCAAIRASIENV